MSVTVNQKISLIAAMSDNRIIGRDNSLPWYLPADLQHFKQMTLNKPIVMGRLTWESLPGLLPQRRHIVLTSDADYVAEGADVRCSLESAIESCSDDDEVMIVGGANLYRQAIEIAARIYLTVVHTTLEGDASFPPVDERLWQLESADEHKRDARNAYDYTFCVWTRR